MKVWLDDKRSAPRGWRRTYTAKATIKLLRTGKVTEISLDHDLGDEKKTGTGYKVLVWIEKKVFFNKRYKPPVMKAHSANTAARKRMDQAIESIEKRVANRGQ